MYALHFRSYAVYWIEALRFTDPLSKETYIYVKQILWKNTAARFNL
jgi:hypothetical protein